MQWNKKPLITTHVFRLNQYALMVLVFIVKLLNAESVMLINSHFLVKARET